MNNYSIDSINKQEFDLFKCEVCDDHLKRRFFELKEMFYKIYKNYIKIFKLVKNKDEISLKKIIEEIGITQKDYIKYRNLVEKLVYIRKISNNSECNKHVNLFHILDILPRRRQRKNRIKRRTKKTKRIA